MRPSLSLLLRAALAALPLASVVAQDATSALALAQKNGIASQRAVAFCLRYAFGWLAHADPKTGLLPRTTEQRFWNAQDCAADNFPFLALTGDLTQHPTLLRAARELLETEQRVTNRIGVLPDDFDFATQTFRTPQPDLAHVIFGAAEYAKDGLLPRTEWSGAGPWVDRMQELVRAIFAQAAPNEADLPSTVVEVNGDLLQACSRLYWLTGDAAFRGFAFRLADHYLVAEDMLAWPKLALRDHGCEVLGGLSEAYVIAAHTDPARRDAWKPRLHRVLDQILACRAPDGLLFDAIDPQRGVAVTKSRSDGFGYVFDAFVTVALVDGEERYRDAVREALAHLGPIRCADTPGMQGADGHADSIEGALTLLRHLPDDGAAQWIDREMGALLAMQKDDGLLEAWYGDGNSARTAWMWALWKTQGVHADPWRADLRLGAACDGDALVVSLASERGWSGTLRFDSPRHAEVLHLPLDYPRINQFPEWFTVARDARYELQRDDGDIATVDGATLLGLEISVPRGKEQVLRVRRR